jgi:hypothetical protein
MPGEKFEKKRYLMQGLGGIGWKTAEELGGFKFGCFGNAINLGNVAFDGFLGFDAFKWRHFITGGLLREIAHFVQNGVDFA